MPKYQIRIPNIFKKIKYAKLDLNLRILKKNILFIYFNTTMFLKAWIKICI
jgi:hypothetical protein